MLRWCEIQHHCEAKWNPYTLSILVPLQGGGLNVTRAVASSTQSAMMTENGFGVATSPFLRSVIDPGLVSYWVYLVRKTTMTVALWVTSEVSKSTMPQGCGSSAWRVGELSCLPVARMDKGQATLRFGIEDRRGCVCNSDFFSAISASCGTCAPFAAFYHFHVCSVFWPNNDTCWLFLQGMMHVDWFGNKRKIQNCKDKAIETWQLARMWRSNIYDPFVCWCIHESWKRCIHHIKSLFGTSPISKLRSAL